MELDPGVAGCLGPRQLPGVPLHERFGVGGDVEVLVQTGIRLADLGLAVLEQQPERSWARKPVKSNRMTTRRSGSWSRRRALHIDHSATNGSRFSGAISSQRAPHSPRVSHTLNRSWPEHVSW